jgi:hypothetical protein
MMAGMRSAGARLRAVMVALALAGCGDIPNGPRPVALFDGVTLAGWTGFSADPAIPWQNVWTALGGTVRCAGMPFGYLRTEETFRNFVLTLELRHLTEGNGGVFVRMQAPDKIWPRAIEAQGQSGQLGDLWNLDDYPMTTDPARTEGPRTVRLAPEVPERDAGEWNHYRIALDRDRLELEVNGVLQNRAEQVAELDGFIALQSEGARYEFRNVVLRPLE